MKRVFFIIISLLFSIFLYLVIRKVRFELELKRIYSKECLIKNGMSLTEVYQLLDTRIKPQLHIQFNRKDSSYRHTVYYPPMWNREYYLLIEYNPYTSEVINYADCD